MSLVYQPRHAPVTVSFIYNQYQVWATSANVYDKNSLRLKFTNSKGGLNEINLDEVENIDWERLQNEAIARIEEEIFNS